MKILIDADGCPVVNETVYLAKKYHVECVIFCDTAHEMSGKGAKVVVVSQGADSVDFALVNQIKNGDIVVTQDYGLAAMCLAKNARVINQDGKEYTAGNIDMLLATRHHAAKVRRAGGRMRGQAKRTAEQNEWFKLSLEKIIKETYN